MSRPDCGTEGSGQLHWSALPEQGAYLFQLATASSIVDQQPLTGIYSPWKRYCVHFDSAKGRSRHCVRSDRSNQLKEPHTEHVGGNIRRRPQSCH